MLSANRRLRSAITCCGSANVLSGAGLISDRDYRVTDVPVRGFWSYWAELMGYEPVGAIR